MPDSPINGFTQADNWLWDHVMPAAKPNTFKIVSAVVRMTTGWHRESTELTFDDFATLAGIANRGTLTTAIEDALGQGFIGREPQGRSFVYSLKIVLVDSPKIVPGDKNQSKNRTDNQSKNRTAVDEALKEKEEKEREEIKPTAPPVDPIKFYEDVTGNYPGKVREHIVIERLGANPNRRALETAYRLWLGRGYSSTHIDGILDYYDNLVANPRWSPNGGGRSFDGPNDNDVWRVVLDHVKRSNTDFDNPLIKAAITESGLWAELKVMGKGGDPSLRRRFLEKYHEQLQHERI